ncbi:MAG TPA: phosphoglycerate dehydrogenase [Acidimicrobiales bacterium]|nr:phosphoglycerate dehydrogenase [Acidimicrobiales bacterium]
MARVLVTEEIADSGLQQLRDAGHTVEIRLGLSPSELIEAVNGANALIIRSATKVDAPTLEAAKELVVVGRAGIGLDNVDVARATELGVMVVNAPVSNILSAAEQTMALLLAQARNIPQAHTALKAGKWERSKWEGVELHGKTLGVVGLGKIGALVAQRASAFGMRLIAFDPYISEERARHMGVELVDLDMLLAQSDFITIHLPKTKETTNLLDAAALAKTKPGVRIINVARGGIVNEADLADAIRNGHVQGAALDVFEKEPTTESPLFELPSVVVVPHLGASTFEAQDKAGITIAEQVQLALAGDFVPYAVNVAAGEVSNAVRPFMGLAEVLGRFIGGLLDGKPADLEVNYLGELAGSGTKILTLCALKGLLTATGHEGVSFVNAPQLAEDHNLTYNEISTVESPEYVNQISVRSGDHEVSGTLVTIGTRLETRIVGVDGHSVEIPPAASMLVVHNDDRPGMIGRVGVALGEAGVSISSMAVGPDQLTKTALMVLSTEIPTPAEVIERLRDADGIQDIHLITLR